MAPAAFDGPVGDWAWATPAGPVRVPLGHDDGLVLRGELDGVGEVAVKLAIARADDSVAAREIIGCTVARCVAARTGLPHIAEPLCTDDRALPVRDRLGEALCRRLALAPALAGARAVLTAHRWSPGRALDQWVGDARTDRPALLSLLAQLAATYHVLGQAGLAHIDNHPGNVLVEPAAAPGWWLADWDAAGPAPPVLVPVVGGRCVLIDWDACCKEPCPAADGALGVPDGCSTATLPAPVAPGATDTHRWNPGEDWARLGLLLLSADAAGWRLGRARALLTAADRAALFGAAADAGFAGRLATGDDGAFFFLCAGASVLDCRPVRPAAGLRRPLDALRYLLATPELRAAALAVGAGAARLPVVSTPRLLSGGRAPPHGPPATENVLAL